MGAASAGMPTVKPGTGRRVDEIGGDAEIRIVIRNLIEEHQRRRFFEGEQFGQRADLQIPMGAVNFFHLAERARGVDKLAQIVEWHGHECRIENR